MSFGINFSSTIFNHNQLQPRETRSKKLRREGQRPEYNKVISLTYSIVKPPNSWVIGSSHFERRIKVMPFGSSFVRSVYDTSVFFVPFMVDNAYRRFGSGLHHTKNVDVVLTKWQNNQVVWAKKNAYSDIRSIGDDSEFSAKIVNLNHSLLFFSGNSISKLNKEGECVWTVQYNDKERLHENFYGSYVASMDYASPGFDTSSDTIFNVLPLGQQNGYVCLSNRGLRKLDSNGLLVWSKSFVGRWFSLRRTQDNSVVMLGCKYEESFICSPLIAKIGLQGDLKWSKNVDLKGTKSLMLGLFPDKINRLIYTKEHIVFGANILFTGKAFPSKDYVLTQLDSDGNVIWSKTNFNLGINTELIKSPDSNYLLVDKFAGSFSKVSVRGDLVWKKEIQFGEPFLILGGGIMSMQKNGHNLRFFELNANAINQIPSQNITLTNASLVSSDFILKALQPRLINTSRTCDFRDVTSMVNHPKDSFLYELSINIWSWALYLPILLPFLTRLACYVNQARHDAQQNQPRPIQNRRAPLRHPAPVEIPRLNAVPDQVNPPHPVGQRTISVDLTSPNLISDILAKNIPRATAIHFINEPAEFNIKNLNPPGFEDVNFPIPRPFICPITMEIMAQPWQISSKEGEFVSCDKIALAKYIVVSKESGITPKVPNLNGPICRDGGLNRSLKDLIETWLRERTVREYTHSSNLCQEVGSWIQRRGRSSLEQDPELREIVHRWDDGQRVRNEVLFDFFAHKPPEASPESISNSV